MKIHTINTCRKVILLIVMLLFAFSFVFTTKFGCANFTSPRCCTSFSRLDYIIYSVFLKCLNKVSCLVNGGFYPQQRLMFWKKHKNSIMSSHCCCRTTLPYLPKNDFSQKSLFVLLNHLWYKPKTIKWFFFMNSLGWVKERVNILITVVPLFLKINFGCIRIEMKEMHMVSKGLSSPPHKMLSPPYKVLPLPKNFEYPPP